MADPFTISAGMAAATALGIGATGAAAAAGKRQIDKKVERSARELRQATAEVKPQIGSPTSMPTPDDELVRRNARRSAAMRSAKSGRTSTFLSGRLGG